MSDKRKAAICALLKGIETGDPASVEVVNPDKYIQHNPQTQEGGEGLAALFKRLSKRSPRVNIVRIFSDGEFVFGHTEYDFGSPRVGFEVFRFEGDQTVEHWDNIQPRKGPNLDGYQMVDGPTVATDLEKTDSNRTFIRSFIERVLIDRQLAQLADYVDEAYVEHNPRLGCDVTGLHDTLNGADAEYVVRYDRHHRILAEGCFVLSVCEGSRNDVHSSFYDLFRVVDGKIVEHWDTTEAVPPRHEWKNDNGKF